MGYLRFSFVIAVLINHLTRAAWEGRVAVYGFYVLSGFLITLVTQEIYSKSPIGRVHFLTNRFLRIYPTYWACALFAYAGLVITHDTLQQAFGGVRLPTTTHQWIANIIIYSIANLKPQLFDGRMLTTAWSLSIELVYYLIIGLIAGYSRVLMILFFIASVFSTLHWLKEPNFYDYLYLTVFGPAPMFFFGGLLYFFREKLKPYCLKNTFVILIITNAALYLLEVAGLYGNVNEIYVLYSMGAILGYCILSLYFTGKEKKGSVIEQFLADVSYPMFLLHTIVTFVTCHYLGRYFDPSIDVFKIGFISTFIASSIVVLLVDRPMKKLRKRIRLKCVDSH